MVLKQYYNEYLQALQAVYEKDEAVGIRNIVFGWAAGISRGDVLLSPEKKLTEEEIKKLTNALDRLLKNEPVQYITGEAWFYGMKFSVTPAVLIPRPETEELVQEVLEFLKIYPSSNVLDIGTGSGCIPISIKKNFPSAYVSAIDISETALEIAKQNARQLNIPVDFLLADILDEMQWPEQIRYDIIISNPPYIPVGEKKMMDKNVTDFEPHLALFVPDEDPLLFYKKIAAFAEKQLTLAGKIFLETHEAYAPGVAAVLEQHGFTPQIKKDISGKERMVLATRSR